jgi:hypothetical protein
MSWSVSFEAKTAEEALRHAQEALAGMAPHVPPEHQGILEAAIKTIGDPEPGAIVKVAGWGHQGPEGSPKSNGINVAVQHSTR